MLGTRWKVLISDSENPKRKYQYTLELTHNGKSWIGINTGLANDLAEEAIKQNQIPELVSYAKLKREHKVGKSRLDIFLSESTEEHKDCYVEIKNVTMKEDKNVIFPDAVTERGLNTSKN